MSSLILEQPLRENDPDLYEIMKKEDYRQRSGLNLLACDNFASRAVLECSASCFSNHFSGGKVGARLYPTGNQFIDEMETLCQKRALEAYRLDVKEWGVNVQPYSGSIANFAVYTALLKPHDRIMGLDVPDGGHSTHGWMTDTKRFSASSIYFESMAYKVNPSTGIIDYDKLLENARLFRPKLIIAGATCYSRLIEYQRFRRICDEVGAILMADMAHCSGLVAAGVIPSPFEFSDIVTTITHKCLRGARAGLIFYRIGQKDVDKQGNSIMYDFGDKIDTVIFPTLQGAPHNNSIAAIAVTLKQASTPEYKQYAIQLVKNARHLSKSLQDRGYRIVTNGTDTHMFVMDVRDVGVDGAKVAIVMDLASISVSKINVPGDKNAFHPGGIRIGTTASTSRNFKEADMETVSEFLDACIKITQAVENSSNGKKFLLKEFQSELKNDEWQQKIKNVRMRVEGWALTFPMPGFPAL